MTKKANGLNKSEEIRQIFNADPNIKIKEVVAMLAAKDIKVNESLVYYVKGNMKGRTARKKRIGKMVAKVAETTGPSDAVATILKVKKVAHEVGGLRKLKALVEALSA